MKIYHRHYWGHPADERAKQNTALVISHGNHVITFAGQWSSRKLGFVPCRLLRLVTLWNNKETFSSLYDSCQLSHIHVSQALFWWPRYEICVFWPHVRRVVQNPTSPGNWSSPDFSFLVVCLLMKTAIWIQIFLLPWYFWSVVRLTAWSALAGGGEKSCRWCCLSLEVCFWAVSHFVIANDWWSWPRAS